MANRFSKAWLLEQFEQKHQLIQQRWNFSNKQGHAQLGQQFDRWLSLEMSEADRLSIYPQALETHEGRQALHSAYLRAEAIAYGQWMELKCWLQELQ